MVNLVNVLVQRTPVQCLVREEVERILEDEEQRNLAGYGSPVGERYLPSCHSNGLCERVEEPDLHKKRKQIASGRAAKI